MASDLEEILTIFGEIALAGGKSVFIYTADMLEYYDFHSFCGISLN